MAAAASMFMLDVMDDMWDCLIDVNDELVEKVEYTSLRDTDRLILHAAGHLFGSKFNELQAREYVCHEHPCNQQGSAAWDTQEERLYRILTRSYELLQPFIELYGDFMTDLLDWNPSLDRLLNQVERADSTSSAIVLNGMRDPPSSAWNCRAQQHSTVCSSKGHFHAADGLTWPKEVEEFEKCLPSPSTTEITLRDFRFKVLAEDKDGRDSTVSVSEAVKKSLQNQYGQRLNIRIYHGDHESNRAVLSRKELPTSLAQLAWKASSILKGHDRKLDLGIILPGGSEVFWPDVAIGTTDKSNKVFIMASESYNDGGAFYKFHAVEVLEQLNHSDIVQSIHFVDLPAEIRNMIYVEMLKQRKHHCLSKKQPPMSLTCRLANKELMALLFKQCGWFVSF